MHSAPLRSLGRSAVQTSRIGLGCATFGREITEDEAFAILDYAFERGITLLDTAEAYGGGQAREYRKKYLGVDDVREVSGEMHSSERIVGRWMHSRGVRSKIVLLTKVTTGFTRQHVREALSASLDRLQTDTVDLYLYHSHDANTPPEEAGAALQEVIAAGLVRAGGCSNYTGEQLRQAAAASPSRVYEVIESNYNLVAREIETDVIPVTRELGMGVITYSPLAAGFLMGKYTPDRNALPKGTRFDVIPGHMDVYFSERNFRWVASLHAMAARTGVPPARLAMSWVFQNPAVDVVLVGARTTAHLDNALAALEHPFPDEWVAEIRAWA